MTLQGCVGICAWLCVGKVFFGQLWCCACLCVYLHAHKMLTFDAFGPCCESILKDFMETVKEQKQSFCSLSKQDIYYKYTVLKSFK